MALSLWQPRHGPTSPPLSAAPPNQLPLNGALPENSLFARPDELDVTRPLDLRPQVGETETGKIMFGVGVNSDAGLVGNISLDERNFDITRWPTSFEDFRDGTAFRGAGEHLRIEAVPGTQLQRYSIDFGEPHLFDTNVGSNLGGYYYDRIYPEWTEERVGGRFSLGYQFTHDLSGSLTFRGERVTVFNPISHTIFELNNVLGHDNDVYGFGARLAHDTRDNAFLATEGHLISFGFEEVVGTFQYPRGDIDLRRFFTLSQRPDGSGRQVLSLVTRLSLTGDDTPIYDTYYGGGFSTIRGFAFRGVSPRDQGVPVGGDAMFLASAEYMFPITADDMLRGVVFCDTGTVEHDFTNWQSVYRVAPGFGLRITIPALGPAPIALDFAFPVSHDPSDQILNFSFFIGFGK